MQLALTRRSANGVALNGQYTLGYSKGNTGGSNEAVTAGNNAREQRQPRGRSSYDNGYNNFDVRHTFNLSALYTIPGNGLLTGGWSIGGIANARSGYPGSGRDEPTGHRLRRRGGQRVQQRRAGRTPVVNMPGGGSSAGLTGGPT